MKTIRKILIIVSVVIIAIGMFLLGKNGLNYANGFTKNLLLETAKSYISYVSIATVVILVYVMIRYSKAHGFIKVLVTTILGIVGAIALVIAIMAIIKMPITRIFFPILLGAYSSCFIVLSSYFEENI